MERPEDKGRAVGIFGRKDDEENEAPPMTAPQAAPAPAAERARPKFGVDEAIVLLRSLPVEQNAELVLKVVRTTLASLNVQLSDIIQDAARKQKTIQDRVAALQAAIVTHEKEIADRRTEIGRLEADLNETTLVRERLQTVEATARPKLPQPATPAPSVIVSPSMMAAPPSRPKS